MMMSQIPFLPPRSPMRFYAVVPDASWVRRMVQAHAPTIQLRCKHLSGSALKTEIQAAIQAASNSNSQLFINDYWQEAINMGAYGVHLGQEDIESADVQALAKAGLRLGISTHSDNELSHALSFQPSYVACGAIFPTTTKQMPTAPQGLARLRKYVQAAANTPTVAIGGIDLNNASEVLATGVSSLAVVRAVTESHCPETTVRQFMALWD